MTLTEFVSARLDEDEATHREIHEARVCSGCSDGWEAGFDPDRCDCGYPARVLRDVEAKRKILALHRPDLAEYVDADGDDRSSLDCLTCETGGVPDSWPCPTLRLLAAVWSDHPDYQPGWAPQ